MNIAIVGCGFVADFYLRTLPNHPDLKLLGVMDRDGERANRFSTYYGLPLYRSLDELLEDKQVDIVVNLTNPRSHYAINNAALEHGKHVYSEKPLSMVFAEAEDLVGSAERKGLYIASAPCNVLSESAQTVWKALRENVIGTVRLVYAEMDDGLVHRMRYRKWISESGSPWPYKDEFEVGCTLEHAGYYVNWLVALFGPASSVTAFSSCQIPDKEIEESVDFHAPDFSVACITFKSGVVARLTCSIIAPHDHRLQIFGDEGILSTKDCWNYGSPVFLKRRSRLSLWARKIPLVKKANFRHRYKGSHQADVCRGIAELSEAIQENRSCRLSSRFSLHVNEIVLAIQNAWDKSAPYILTSTFDPIEPMPWAQD